MYEQQFTESAGDRPDVPNVAVLITDGMPSGDVDEVVAMAHQAAAAGITIITIGISSRVDQLLLAEISLGHIWMMSGVSDLEETRMYITNDVCTATNIGMFTIHLRPAWNLKARFIILVFKN